MAEATNTTNPSDVDAEIERILAMTPEECRLAGIAEYGSEEAWRMAMGELRAKMLKACGLQQPTPSPTGTELALDEAKRHIAILTAFWMDNAAWTKAANDARAFISGVPRAALAEGAE